MDEIIVAPRGALYRSANSPNASPEPYSLRNTSSLSLLAYITLYISLSA